jgi:MerR family transcriptional regulator, copper efflux regulator
LKRGPEDQGACKWRFLTFLLLEGLWSHHSRNRRQTGIDIPEWCSMNISQASAQSGLPAKTIRYYEEIGLLAPARRRANGYREYGESEVHTLKFLGRARDIGFSVDDCRALAALYTDRNRKSADVKALALARVADIDRKLAELQAMRRVLNHLAERCHGDDRPDCPILDDLAGAEEA